MRFHRQRVKNFPALWHVIDAINDILIYAE